MHPHALQLNTLEKGLLSFPDDQPALIMVLSLLSLYASYYNFLCLLYLNAIDGKMETALLINSLRIFGKLLSKKSKRYYPVGA